MKLSTLATLIAISSLIFLLNADSIAPASSTGDPPSFELMDLTELLKSLDLTYQDLAMNLSTLNTLTNLPSPSQAEQKQATAAVNQSKPSTQANSKSTIPSPTQTQDTKAVQTPKVTPPVVTPPTPTPQKTVTVPSTPKTATTTTQDTKATKNIQPASTTSTVPSSSTTSSPKSSSSNSPTFGPGPIDKSLPPVIDLTKMTVDYVAPTSSSSSTSASSKSNNKPATTSTSTQTDKNIQANSNSVPTSTKSTTTSAVKSSTANVANPSTNSQTQSTSSTTSQPPTPASTPAPSAPPKTQTTTATQTQTPPASKPQVQTATESISPKPTQAPVKIVTVAQTTDKNSVYLEPIPSSNTQASTDDSKKSFNQNKQVIQPQVPSSIIIVPVPAPTASSSPSALQCWNSDDSAIYNITPSYKSFSPYFIITKNDPYLLQLRTYLINNYGNYLSQGQIIAGFRVYNNNGDNSLDYQLLFSTFYGTFTTILTYWPDTNRIMLKTLSILNFYIMELDYSNCQTQDLSQQNCKVCNDGYRNFMGRCRAVDPFCRRYLSDECGACVEGKKLSNGQCQ